MPHVTLCSAKRESIPAAALAVNHALPHSPYSQLSEFSSISDTRRLKYKNCIYCNKKKNLILFQSVYDFTPDKATFQIYINQHWKWDGFKTQKTV